MSADVLTKKIIDILKRYSISFKTANDSAIKIQVNFSKNFKIIENKYVTFSFPLESLESVSQIGLEIYV